MRSRKVKILYGLEATEGGALKHLVYLVTNLNPEIFHITVVLSHLRKRNVEKEIQQMKDAGAEVKYISMQRIINPFLDLESLIKTYFFIKEERFDIVHAHSSKAGAIFRIAARLNGIAQIYYTPHCFYFQGASGLKRYLFLGIEKLLSRITSRIIVSTGEKKFAIQNKACRVDQLININNSIKFNEYRTGYNSDIIKAKFNIPSGDKIVTAIGRLAPQKDWNTFVHAASTILKEISNVTFLIVGEGALEGRIKKEISKLKGDQKILTLGFIEEVGEILSITDVFVNTSLWEGLPYVYLEAMRYKKPIIATSINNELDLLNNDTSLLIRCKDHTKLVEHTLRLLNNKNIASHLGERGYQHLSLNYSFKEFISSHENMYLSFKG